MTDTSFDERRTRRRRSSISIDDEEVVSRVIDFYNKRLEDSSTEREIRLQRYAKFRMWTEGKDWPWENSADTPMPDIMEKVLRTNDTLHNAVMIQRPPVGSKALHKSDVEKQKTVDNLIDYQVFEEQPGEEIIGECAECFTLDGVFTAFIPWVKEKRETRDIREFDPIPEEMSPPIYFLGLLRQNFPNAVYEEKPNGWDWTVTPARPEEERFDVRFYTRSNRDVEMVVVREVVVYDGPRVIVKDYDDVFHPPRAANLQIPGPSNPGGASHVILRDKPTVDEIRRLQRSGFYDRVSRKDMDSLGVTDEDDTDDEVKAQKDDFQGVTKTREKVESHRTLTRLMCFDMFDIDGDGIDEDVIFWVLLETKTLLKVAALTEMYPANPPRRPFAEASMIPIKGRRAGISMPEMLEGIHDTAKMLMDQTIDAGTIRNSPFGFYRATGTLKPEVIRLWPGELYPLGDPQRDIAFPTIGNQNADAHSLNLLTILNTQGERLTSVGALQFGQVPAGKSSALRTASSIALLANQAEARPERILRRFFSGLSEIWAQIHELNQAFLPKGKQYRIAGVDRPGDDPYQTITDRGAIQGRFQFTFSANVLNASKQAMQQALGAMMQLYVSPLALQLGLIDEGGIYRLFRDFAKSQGQDPDRYIKEPTPGAMRPRITAEEAIAQILRSQIPDGEPFEGPIQHLQTLQRFATTRNEFGLLNPDQVELYRGYMQITAQKAEEFIRRQQIEQAAGQFNQGQGTPGRPPTAPPQSLEAPQVNSGELIDESLPSAGGGTVQ